MNASACSSIHEVSRSILAPKTVDLVQIADFAVGVSAVLDIEVTQIGTCLVRYERSMDTITRTCILVVPRAVVALEANILVSGTLEAVGLDTGRVFIGSQIGSPSVRNGTGMYAVSRQDQFKVARGIIAP